MNYYISDLHLGSQRICELCNRPFKTVEEMNAIIIDNINNTCSAEDTLYILGDVGGGTTYMVPMLRHLQPKLILIIGNHDVHQLQYRTFRDCFERIENSMVVKDGSYKIFLNHYPVAEWNGYWQNVYHLYGHVHNADKGPAILMNCIPHCANVSADVTGFKPMTADELFKDKQNVIYSLMLTGTIPFNSSDLYISADERNGKNMLKINGEEV